MLFIQLLTAIAALTAASFAFLQWKNTPKMTSNESVETTARYQSTVRMLHKLSEVRSLLNSAQKLELLLEDPEFDLTRLKTVYAEFQRYHKAVLDLQAEIHAILAVSQIETRTLHGARELLSMRERQLSLVKKLQSDSKNIQNPAARQTFVPLVADLQSSIESYLSIME